MVDWKDWKVIVIASRAGYWCIPCLACRLFREAIWKPAVEIPSFTILIVCASTLKLSYYTPYSKFGESVNWFESRKMAENPGIRTDSFSNLKKFSSFSEFLLTLSPNFRKFISYSKFQIFWEGVNQNWEKELHFLKFGERAIWNFNRFSSFSKCLLY